MAWVRYNLILDGKIFIPNVFKGRDLLWREDIGIIKEGISKYEKWWYPLYWERNFASLAANCLASAPHADTVTGFHNARERIPNILLPSVTEFLLFTFTSHLYLDASMTKSWTSTNRLRHICFSILYINSPTFNGNAYVLP